MHLRNPYNYNPPDFDKLSKEHPRLAKYLKGRRYNGAQRKVICFKDAKALRELTYAIMKVDFDLNVSFPLDYICGGVPGRIDYILLVEDIIGKTTSNDENVYGIDIGTGASCIYPLLACRMRKTWHFLATDISDVKILYARDNVARNKLDGRIYVVRMDSNKDIIPTNSMDEDKTYNFLMCNPPFFASAEEMEVSRKMKKRHASSRCVGVNTDLITLGGEVKFVLRIIAESNIQKQKIR